MVSSGGTHRHCCVPQCLNDSRTTLGIHFHRLPGNKMIRKPWIVKIGRDPGSFSRYHAMYMIYFLQFPMQLIYHMWVLLT